MSVQRYNSRGFQRQSEAIFVARFGNLPLVDTAAQRIRIRNMLSVVRAEMLGIAHKVRS